MPEVLSFKKIDGQKRFEDVSEEIQNAEELRQLLEESTERVLRHDPDPEPQQNQQQEKQRRKKEQQQGAR